MAVTLKFPDFQPGHVWLVGAGCGDAGLLTLHAHHALQAADIVYYDSLVSADVLSFCAPQAQLCPAGKAPGESCRQEQVTEQLIRSAQQGLRVVRLKGGDPFLFGRGAEEAEALVAAAIPFRVIPGITSAQGGLAYAGIPLTHRDHNSAVSFLSGHLAGEEWGGGPGTEHAIKAPVLVIYMGLRRFPAIRARLLAAGRPASEPLAFLSHGTTPQQKTWVTTLEDSVGIWEKVERPALIVLGETIRLRDTLATDDGRGWHLRP